MVDDKANCNKQLGMHLYDSVVTSNKS